MKRIPAMLVMHLLFLSADVIHAEVLIRPNDTGINYLGRFDFANSSTQVRFNWPGSVIEAAFPGPSIGIELTDGGAYFNVEIDGVLVDSLRPTTTTHRTVKTDLSTTANHAIRLTLRTNGQNCSFGGFYLADGKALAARPALPYRKIEFIGDSWTAGDVIGSTTSNALQYFNAALTYARLTTLAFHAQDQLLARGGCGMVKTNGGGATMPARYPKIMCDGTANWNFTSWIPDLVVIFMGINDFNNNVSDADFRTAYTAFINTVRGHYANVPIVLIGLKDNVNGHNILTNVQTVAQSFSKVSTFSSPITLANASALWQHPNQAQHRQIANALIPAVMQATGWDTLPPVATGGPDSRPAGQSVCGANPLTLKTAQEKIVFYSGFSRTPKQVAVYDCSGRLVRKRMTRDQTVFLRKDLALPRGMYIVKITALR